MNELDATRTRLRFYMSQGAQAKSARVNFRISYHPVIFQTNYERTTNRELFTEFYPKLSFKFDSHY
jgi:hypothetical protein